MATIIKRIIKTGAKTRRVPTQSFLKSLTRKPGRKAVLHQAPVITLNQPLSQTLIDIYKLRKEVDEREEKLGNLEDKLIDFIQTRQDKDGLAKNWHGSYALRTASNRDGCLWVSTDNHNIDDDDLPEARKLLGNAIIRKEVVTTQVLTTRPGVLNNPVIVDQLRRRLGDKLMQSIFYYRQELETAPGLNQRIYGYVNSIKQLEAYREIFHKANPYLRLQ